MTTPNTHHHTEPQLEADAALSVWATAQTPPATQRRGRYVPESTAHPGKMLPAIAAHAIAGYTQPDDLVLDPMCGIGTTLVEALHLGRRAVGVEYEPRWAAITEANLELAHRANPGGRGRVVRGDARDLDHLLPRQLRGQVALVVTSPPYGDSVHGQVDAVPGGGIDKWDHEYGTDRGNLARGGDTRLLDGIATILRHAARFLRPGGHAVITARPWRRNGELIDLPSHIQTLGADAGLVPTRKVALLCRLAGGHLIARGSFFQNDYTRKQRANGIPLHLIAHEDVIILRKPLNLLKFRKTEASSGGT